MENSSALYPYLQCNDWNSWTGLLNSAVELLLPRGKTMFSVYSFLMINCWFHPCMDYIIINLLVYMQVYVTGFIPYIGKTLNFLLLSWMYAYYCFEWVVTSEIFFLICWMHYGQDICSLKLLSFSRYKWNFSGLRLDKRLDFFESNWAFFAGFGKNLMIGFTPGPIILSGFNLIFGPVFQIDNITTHCWKNDECLCSKKTKPYSQ